MSFETADVERKVLGILKVLSESRDPVGSHLIARRMENHGVNLTERAVRYHLKLTDERGFTELISKRDGRKITDKGLEEIKRALVKDKVGFAISRIEQLSYRTNFDYTRRQGEVPVNVSIIPNDSFPAALDKMRPIFESGWCASQLCAVAHSGRRMGDLVVPEGATAFATVCSIVINGALLKSGVPMDSRFGGILQIKDRKPKRFTEIIHYNGCSLDPSEIFLRARMTSVNQAALTGSGEILANFREVPSICLPTVERVLDSLKSAGLGQVLVFGAPSESVCEVPVELNKIGMVLLGGLNPVAAAMESGMEARNHSMSTVIDYCQLAPFQDVCQKTFEPVGLAR
jgi:HTH-type transcriptional regulator, global nitrogen regulator NrpRI